MDAKVQNQQTDRDNTSNSLIGVFTRFFFFFCTLLPFANSCKEKFGKKFLSYIISEFKGRKSTVLQKKTIEKKKAAYLSKDENRKASATWKTWFSLCFGCITPLPT